jgi:hypothetical protein
MNIFYDFGNNVAIWDVKMFPFAWFRTVLGSYDTGILLVLPSWEDAACQILSKLSSFKVLQYYLMSQHLAQNDIIIITHYHFFCTRAERAPFTSYCDYSTATEIPVARQNQLIFVLDIIETLTLIGGRGYINIPKYMARPIADIEYTGINNTLTPP